MIEDLCRLITIHRTGSDIILYYRTKNGKKKITIPFTPYFYVPGKGESQDLFGNPVKKITVNDPSDVPHVRRLYDKHYEADVPYTRRFLIDMNIKSYFQIKQHSKIELYPIENPTEQIPMKIWYLDIEVHPGDSLPSPENPTQEITSITVYDKSIKKYFTLCLNDNRSITKKDDWNLAFFSSEEELLYYFSRMLIRADPDIITGWNVYFDINYLTARMKKLNIPLDLSSCEIFDLLTAYKILYKRPSYSLQDVMRYENCGNLKKYSTKDLRELKPDVLAEYNFNDVKAIVTLDNLLDIINYFLTLKEVAGVSHLEDAFLTSVLLDTLLLRLTRQRKVILPSKPEGEDHEPYEGALVIQPKPGIHENVAVIDINRCYPSIIRAFNISPETITNKPKEEDIIIDQNIGFKRTPRGILSTLVDIIWNERDKMEKILSTMQPGTESYEQIARKRDALKGLLNAIYGFTGYVKSRIYDVRLAKTVVRLAKEVLQFLINYYNNLGYDVIYADTDGCFVKMPFEISQKVLTESENALNAFLIEKYKLQTNRPITIKIDKYACTAFFTDVKKRYALWVINERNKPCDYIDITGFESVRRDTPIYLQGVIKKLLEMVLKRKTREEIIEFLKMSLEEFKIQPLDHVAISKAITKPFDQYDVKPPHVRGAIIANLYLNANLRPSDRVKMLWVKNIKGIPKTDVICYDNEDILPKEIEIDWERMFETTIKNKIETILAHYNVTWDDIQNKPKQGDLEKWL